MSSQHFARRLPPRSREVIQRHQPLRFSFEGREYSGYAGDTISSALWAEGVHVLSRSFKYHRPRADFVFDGSGSGDLVQVEGEPNVRAGRRRIRGGMAVDPQNVTPSLGFDVLAVNGLLHRFLPVGFYYKAFHTRQLWPLYERLLRGVAGLGRVESRAPIPDYDKQYKQADVIVVGGGPAGLSAAYSAAESGAVVLLIEQEPSLGGHLRYEASDPNGRPNSQLLSEQVEQVVAHEGVEVLLGAVAMGYFEDHWIPAFTQDRLYKIRGKSLVVATGARQRTLIFTNNDLPGIMTGSGAARLLNLYAVRPGREVLVVSAHDDGLRLALEMQAAGVQVTIAEERPERTGRLVEKLDLVGIQILWRHLIGAAHGRGHVRGASLLPLSSEGKVAPSHNDAVRVGCDAIVLSVGYSPDAGLLHQSGAEMAWDESRRAILPLRVPQGVLAAGRVVGSHGARLESLEGRIAGVRAAVHAGVPARAEAGELAELEASRSAPGAAATRYFVTPGPGPFRFVDLAEDVTEKDVRDAISEGYQGIELLKRFTTISMGPDQGRYSSLNSALLTARASGRKAEEVGTTTSRPPTFPVKMGLLRDRVREPVRRTPLHDWHARYGCEWMNAGRWKRPDFYHKHSPAEEVLNVRRGVGIIDVSTLGKIMLYGRDVPELLARLYTNKWGDLPRGRIRYGVMCNEQGVIMDDGVTARLEDGRYYMTTSTAMSQAIPEWALWWLEQPGWELEVHLVNVTTRQAAINVAGPSSRELLSRLSEDVDLSKAAFPFMSVRACKLAGVAARLLRLGFTGELSYEAHVPAGYAEHIWTALLEAGRDLGVTPFGLEAQGILRLEKGHFIGQDLDAIANPLETEAAWAVDLDKEDFLGKAMIAHKKGKGLRRELIGFEMVDPNTVPPEGSLVVDEAPDGDLGMTGWVTSARFSPTLEKAIGLAWVSRDWRAPGTEITISTDGRRCPAQVCELPFYDPEGRALRR